MVGLDYSYVNDLNLFVHKISQGTEMGLFFICIGTTLAIVCHIENG
jgi:hypothetical protein